MQRSEDNQFSSLKKEWKETHSQNYSSQNVTKSLGSIHEQPQRKFEKTKYCNIQLSQKQFAKRKSQIQSIRHEYVFPSQWTCSSYQTVNKVTFVKEITEIRQSGQYESLQSLINKKRQFSRKELVSLINQMVTLMTFCEKNKVYHGNLSPNAILLQKQCLQNQQSSEGDISPRLIKVVNWGWGNQAFKSKKLGKKIKYESYLESLSSSPMFQFYHPQVLFQVNNTDGLSQIQRTSKSDIWSFGIILYKLRYSHHPFFNQKKFDLNKQKQYFKSFKKLQLQEQSIENSMIQKMLSLNDFLNWEQIKTWLIDNVELSYIDFLTIRQVYCQHYALMAYLIQVYKLTVWNLNNSPSCFWLQNRSFVRKFIVYFLKMMHLVHNQKFESKFGFRKKGLLQIEQDAINNFTSMINAQWKHIFRNLPQDSQKIDFYGFLDQFKFILIKIRIGIEDYESIQNTKNGNSSKNLQSQTWKSLKHIDQFCSNLTQTITEIDNLNKLIFEKFFEITKKVLK